MSVIIRGRRVLFLQAQPGDGPQPVKKPPCPYCDKPGHPFAPSWGSNLGSSSLLRDNILAGQEPASHPWYTGRWSIAAHHLICCEAMEDDEDWATFCRQFCYDINRKQNGVILPMVMAVACELGVPLHCGPHSGGWAFDMDLAYPDAVRSKLRNIRHAIQAGAYCSNPEALVRKLDALSAEILGKVANGTWTLTTDGLDYLKGGDGCAGVKSIQDKPHRPCPVGRRHGILHAQTLKQLVRRPLQVEE